jgi:cyanate lyase
MGMNAFPSEKAALMVATMGLPQEAESVLAESPTKIWEQAVPTDPCIYRFYEIVGVYGPTLKALIQEKFGDGIMSAIDFEMSVTRVENPKGDRVNVEMSGKYLGYNSW